jgi:hypothetical protein
LLHVYDLRRFHCGFAVVGFFFFMSSSIYKICLWMLFF